MNNFEFPYTLAYYRRNNFGKPCVWYAHEFDFRSIEVYHGIVGNKLIYEIIKTNRNPKDEIISRINAKRKTGYKGLWELKDGNSLPVEGELLSFLQTYLPVNRSTEDNNLLPMLAKTYTPRIFDKCSAFYGQYKINGLRCFVRAEITNDIFKTKHLIFQSREGTIWNSLQALERYLINIIPDNFFNFMIDNDIILDGELYLPNHTVNEINHFVKDNTCPENQLLQYWCYDLAIEDCIQEKRLSIVGDYLHDFIKPFSDYNDHLNNRDKFVVLPNHTVYDHTLAVTFRNKFIDCGFEGLILRNPKAEYQYGKRNSSMIKFKTTEDGLFIIKDIYSEGIKRKDIPLILLKNDINDVCFEVHLNGTFAYQKSILDNKEQYIGKKVYVSYGERSGINKVPFHVKEVTIIDK